ncbi:hypothetical protein H312_02216 [Anncaliia algerae PRA339]|uniref:Uncharacterized protein n=1 Tax=Anncaliia algerae PRA339 TaxID=1288291 RepID=A0A059EZP5_9MICR|nr:hypothetical protein H312_02216 [Anncaliia algerae PRA339]
MKDKDFLQSCIKKYYEPKPTIGKNCTIKILRVTPTCANSVITHIEGIKPSINYFAYTRASDLEINVIEEKFVWDILKEDESLNAKIIGYNNEQMIFVVPKKE